MADETLERRAIEQLAADYIVERRRARRWSIFFRFVWLGVVGVGLVVALAVIGAREAVCLTACTAVVNVEGEIEQQGRASAALIISGLQAAFKHPGTKGVVLRINSPGGSPVQAGQIYDEAKRLRAKYPNTPLYAVVEEMAASGGYYVAVAADRIYVDKASIVGSIGVILEGFGFVGSLEKLGAERRVIAAGGDKAFLDPFTPLPETQRAYAQTMLDEIHQQFIGVVRDGRGKRLREAPELFSGLFWHGQRAVELGLADELGSIDHVAREVIKAEEVVDFTPEEDLTERLSRRFGATLAREFAAGVRAAGIGQIR